MQRRWYILRTADKRSQHGWRRDGGGGESQDLHCTSQSIWVGSFCPDDGRGDGHVRSGFSERRVSEHHVRGFSQRLQSAGSTAYPYAQIPFVCRQDVEDVNRQHRVVAYGGALTICTHNMQSQPVADHEHKFLRLTACHLYQTQPHDPTEGHSQSVRNISLHRWWVDRDDNGPSLPSRTTGETSSRSVSQSVNG